MSKNIIEITTVNFEHEVIKSEKPVLLDFWATWCPPCMATVPELEKFASAHPEIKVGKINVDEQGELATLFNVNSIPTLFLIKDGKAVAKTIGAMTFSELEAKFAL